MSSKTLTPNNILRKTKKYNLEEQSQCFLVYAKTQVAQKKEVDILTFWSQGAPRHSENIGDKNSTRPNSKGAQQQCTFVLLQAALTATRRASGYIHQVRAVLVSWRHEALACVI